MLRQGLGAFVERIQSQLRSPHEKDVQGLSRRHQLTSTVVQVRSRRMSNQGHGWILSHCERLSLTPVDKDKGVKRSYFIISK